MEIGDYTEPLEHTWNEGQDKSNATCGVFKHYTCTVCGATKDESTGQIQHTYGAWTSTTGDDKETHERTCSVCNTIETQVCTYGEWTVSTPAGCTTEGEEKRVCSVCTREEAREIRALDHIWSDVWTFVSDDTPNTHTDDKHDRGCTREGCTVRDSSQSCVFNSSFNQDEAKATFTCTLCGNEYEVTYVAKVDNTYYESVEAAIDAANGGTVTLVNDVACQVTISKSVTLVGNGKKIQVQTGDAITIGTAGINVVLNGVYVSSEAGIGVVAGNESISIGDLEILGGTYITDGNSDGGDHTKQGEGAVRIYSSGNVSIQNASFKGGIQILSYDTSKVPTINGNTVQWDYSGETPCVDVLLRSGSDECGEVNVMAIVSGNTLENPNTNAPINVLVQNFNNGWQGTAFIEIGNASGFEKGEMKDGYVRILNNLESTATVTNNVIIDANGKSGTLSYLDVSKVRILNDGSDNIVATLDGKTIQFCGATDEDGCEVVDAAYQMSGDDYTVIDIYTTDGMMWFNGIDMGSGEWQNTLVKLRSDIDMDEKQWVTKNIPYDTFDGDNHTISNLVCIQETENGRGGLFGYTGGATIKNLMIDGLTAEGSQVAVIGGNGENTTVLNVTLKGIIDLTWKQNSGSYKESWGGIGVIEGVHHDSSTVSNITIADGCTVTLNKQDLTETKIEAWTSAHIGGGKLGSETLAGTYTLNGTGQIVIVYSEGFSQRITGTEDVFEVSNVEGLEYFRDRVNGGDSFSGMTVKLVTDINLESKEWTPIGKDGASFMGTFDGKTNTISNLKISLPGGSNVGLFGKIDTPAIIKDLTVEDVEIVGKVAVGAIAGGYTGTIDGCHVKGKISITGNYKVGGIIGDAYVNVKNCTVEGNGDGSFVKGVYSAKNFEGDNVGGAIGFTGENTFSYKNIHVSGIDVEGSRKVGGVIGYLHRNSTIEDSSFKNGTVSSNAGSIEDYVGDNVIIVGGVVGEYSGDTGTKSIKNCEVESIEISSSEKAGPIYGGTRGSTPLAESGNTYTSVTITINVLPESNPDYSIDGATYKFIGTFENIFVNVMDDHSEDAESIYHTSPGGEPLTQTFDGNGAIISGTVYIVTSGYDPNGSASDGRYVFTDFKASAMQIGARAKEIVIQNNELGMLAVDAVGGSVTLTDNKLSGDGSDVGMDVFWNGNGIDAGTMRAAYLYLYDVDLTLTDNVINGGYRDGIYICLRDCNSTFTSMSGNTFSGYGGDTTRTQAAIKIYAPECTCFYTGSGNKAEITNQDLLVMLKGLTVTDKKDEGESRCLFALDNTRYDFNGVKTVKIETAADLRDYLTAFTDAGSGNSIVSLVSDITLNPGEVWIPITVDGYNGADVITVNGNGHFIAGLSAPLFSGGFAGGSGIVIDRLTIKDSTMISNNATGSGAFVECADSMDVITLTDCHLLNVKLTATNSESRLGGLVGYATGYIGNGPVFADVTIVNCTVEGCELSGYGSVGGIIGHAGANANTSTKIENCTVKDTKITSSKNGDYRVGVVIGTANGGDVIISGITNSGNTVTQSSATTLKVHDLVGRFALNGTGVVKVDGVTVP